MRGSLWRDRQRERRDELKATIESIAQTMRDLSEALRGHQTRRGELTAELRQLEQVNIDEMEIPDAEHLEAEYQRLLNLPGVMAIRVVNDKLSLLLHARIEYGGEVYDLGDWELRFDTSGYLETKELRSGVLSSWRMGYPVYRGGDTTFCFGARQPEINGNLMKGQLLEAIELAVNSIQSVNDEHMIDIPNAFRKEAIPA
jgi:hypothetical protein